jgi:hypothetical protein
MNPMVILYSKELVPRISPLIHLNSLVVLLQNIQLIVKYAQREKLPSRPDSPKARVLYQQ